MALTSGASLLAQFDVYLAPSGSRKDVYARLCGATFPLEKHLVGSKAQWDQTSQSWLFLDQGSFEAFSEALASSNHNSHVGLAEEAATFAGTPGIDTQLNRLLELGANSLTNLDLLCLLLSFDEYLSEPSDTGRQLFSEFGSLGAILGCEPERLMSLPNVTPRVRGLLKAIQLTIERVLHESIQTNPVIGSKQALLDYLRVRLRHRQREELLIIYLNRQNRLIKTEDTVGTVNHVPLYPREIVARALELFASAIIVVHNHPGGDAQASKEDIISTRKLNIALEAVDIQLYDHLIISETRTYSFKADGII